MFHHVFKVSCGSISYVRNAASSVHVVERGRRRDDDRCAETPEPHRVFSDPMATLRFEKIRLPRALILSLSPSLARKYRHLY